VRFLQKRWVVCDLRVAQKLQAILAFVRFLERDLQLRLKFSA
jgi:hypothetical protein